MKKFHLFKPLFFLVLIVFFGVFGYMSLSSISFVDALWMTIITMTTVGFGEVHPLSPEEKVFTMVLILVSIVNFGFVVRKITEYLIEGNFLKQLKDKKMHKKINQLESHTIVCGYGRNGKQAVSKLKSYARDCVIVERNTEINEDLEESNLLFVNGDATLDDTLEEANIHQAKYLIAALPSDADNLFIVLSARQLNKNLTIISRASNASSWKKLKIAGADNVIMPDKIGGDHMASLVVTPDVVEFVERLTLGEENSPNLKEVHAADLPSKYLGKTILDLDLRNKTGCTIIGFKAENNDYLINPAATTILQKDTSLIVLGTSAQIQKLVTLFD